MSQADLAELAQTLSALSDVQKLEIIENLARSLRTNGKLDADQRRGGLQALRRDLASLPTTSPADGLSNRDHDRLLYGGKA